MSSQLSGRPDPSVEGRDLAGTRNAEKVAVVLSGAVARGAFQAGALGQVMTTLFVNGIRPSIFVGTSAGAINAALWVLHAAGRDVRTVDDIMGIAADVNDVWRGMSADRTFEPLWSVGTATRLGWPALRGLWRDGDGVASLLDTAPLQEMAHRILDEPMGLPEGVDALGVVCTWSPGSTREVAGGAGRSVLFLQERQPQGWGGRLERALDVARGPIRAEHVLASSAVPAAFPAQLVTKPPERAGYYVDGGVRLNTPMEAAFALGATRVVLISAMSLAYPRYLPPDPQARPGTLDALSQVLHAVVADRAVEDLMNVRRVNRMVTQARQAGVEQALTGSGGRPYRLAEVIAVSPPPGQLGALAEEVWRRTYADRRSMRRSNAILGRLLRVLGDGPGRGEMLSYLLFDEDYFTDSIRYGRQAAVHALARGWKTDQIVDGWKPSSGGPGPAGGGREHPLSLLGPHAGEPHGAQQASVPAIRISLTRADQRHRSTHGRKTEITWDGSQLFAEEVVVTVLRRAGWRAFWADRWRRRYWPEGDWPDPTLERWLRQVAADLPSGRGQWDVIAAKDGRIVAYEVKGPGDRLSPEQLAWFAAAAQHGLDTDTSAVLTWSPPTPGA